MATSSPLLMLVAARLAPARLGRPVRRAGPASAVVVVVAVAGVVRPIAARRQPRVAVAPL